MCRRLVLSGLLLLMVNLCAADVIDVNWDGSGDYTTIQAAIDAAVNGDEVVVADGTYTGDGNRDIRFWGKEEITIRSLNGPHNCIIDCQGTETEPHIGFHFRLDGSKSIIEGITIKNGYSLEGDGGAILIQSSSPKIKRCILKGNSASFRGAGIYCSSSESIIDGCIFVANDADLGGGIYCYGSQLLLTNCTLTGNFSRQGGAVGSNVESDITITNSILWNNYPDEIINDGYSIINVSFSLIQWGWEGTNIIEADPLFADDSSQDALEWDLHLAPSSFCIDAGTNNPPEGLASIDLDGNLRIIDGDNDGTSTVDMGAYEALQQDEPVIYVSCDQLIFKSIGDSFNPPDQTFSVRNAGGGTLEWQIVENCDWVSISPETGTSTGEEVLITTSVDATGFEFGSYECELIISSASAINSPLSVKVILQVAPTLDIWVPYHYDTIQTAINEAENGDEVIVADGIYTGDGNRDIDFRGRAISVRSENGPENCIIDCQGSETEEHRGFRFHSYENSDSILDGFTVTNGYMYGNPAVVIYECSPTILNCIFTNNTGKLNSAVGCYWSTSLIQNCTFENNTAFYMYKNAGALYCRTSEVTAIGCIFRANKAHYGGGVQCRSSDKLTLQGCIFENNTATLGGGIYCEESCELTISDCTFIGNSCESSTGYPEGGAIYTIESGLTVNNSTFIENNSSHSGGALMLADSSSFVQVIKNSAFIGNSTGGYGGGGIRCNGVDVTITNCIFTANSATSSEGGAIYLYDTIASLLNSTIYANTAPVRWGNNNAVVVNSILRNNGEKEILSGNPLISYCNVKGDCKGEGNIDIEPLFTDISSMDPTEWDLRLQHGCFSIDAGTNNPTAGLPDTDLVGNPRVVDGDNDSEAVVDIGAFETPVSDEPVIGMSMPEIEFRADVGGLNPEAQVIGIYNAGGGTLDWQIQESCDWLSAEPISGTSSGTPSNIDNVEISVDISGLSWGAYTCLVEISAPGAVNNPRILEVHLYVASELYVPMQYPTIQAAIDSTVPGDEIIIADGTYTGDGNRDIDFKGKEITVRSANGPTNCIIDCEALIGDWHRGFYFHSGETENSVLEGVTIINGHNDGGGIRCEDSGPVIKGCVFRENYRAIEIRSGNPVIENCVFINNESYTGAGIFCSEDETTLIGCLFQENMAGDQGGGLYCSYSNAKIKDCVFKGNTGRGGGASCTYATPSFTNCIFVSNTSGINNYESNPLIYNCVFSDTGMALGGSTSNKGNVINSTFYGNSSGGDAVIVGGPGLRLTNCIIWGNELIPFIGAPLVSFSDVQGGWKGEGNVDLDPLFADTSSTEPLDWDLHLQFMSPCMDSGTNEVLGGLGSTDIEGNERLVDGDNDGVMIVDMGAYEVQFSEDPLIGISSLNLTFVGQEGGENPEPQVLTVRNAGGGTLEWLIEENCDWLSLDQTSGTSSGIPSNVTDITVSVDTTDLEFGTYTCLLEVSAADAVNSPLTVEVELYVSRNLMIPGDFQSIQDAVDAAQEWDVLIVSEGIYKENIDFKGKNITVCSSDPHDWEVVTSTIIDGNCSGSCVVFENGETNDAVLEGLTLVGGSGTEIPVYNYYNGAIGDETGGGIYCRDSSPTIRNCLIADNGFGPEGECITRFGGGIALVGNCKAKISNCIIAENAAAICGGGVIIRSTEPDEATSLIWNCTISNNLAQAGGWTPDPERAYEVDCWDTKPTIMNSIIYGGEIRSLFISDPSLVRYCDVKETYLWEEGYWDAVLYDLTIAGGNISQDPLFLFDRFELGDGISVRDHHLMLGSPCIDAGDPNYVPDENETDIDGQLRIMGPAVDIGADEVSPGLYVTKPEGGEVWAAKSTHNIEWQSSAVAGTVDIFCSFDGGEKYRPITKDTENTGSYSWKVPVADSNECMIKVVAHEELEPVEYGYSGLFTIRRIPHSKDVDITWPTLGGDFQRSGLSINAGPKVGCVKWKFDTDGPVNSSVVVGADENVHIVCSDGKIYTLDPDGNLVWTCQLSAGQQGPLTRWDFDETSGDIAADSASGYDGILYNFAEDDSKWIGGALEFDGLDDYVVVPGFKGITGDNPRTISAWIKPEVSTGSYEVLSWGDASGTGTKWLLLVTDQTETGRGVLRIAVQGGRIESRTNLYDGQWHHIAMVLEDDGSADASEIKIFVDGRREAAGSSAACAINTTDSSDVTIGVYGTTGTRFFKGLIDDLRIYDYARAYMELGVVNFGGPTVGSDGAIYVGCDDNKLYAIDKDGQIRWTHDTEGFIYSSPAIDAEGRVFYGSTDGKVYAVGEDGSELWTFELPGSGFISNSITSSGAIGIDDTLYIGGLYSSKLYAIEAESGSLKWECDFSHPADPDNPYSPIIHGSVFFSPVVGVDGTVFVCPTYDTKLYAIDPNEGDIIWSADMTAPLEDLYPLELIEYFTPANCWSEPVLGPDGTIYVSFDDPFIRAVNADGSIKWITQVGMRGPFTFVVGADGFIYASSEDGSLYVLDPEGQVVSAFDSVGKGYYPVTGAEGTIYLSDSAGAVWAVSHDDCQEKRIDLTWMADLNSDGKVTLADMARLASDWGLCSADFRLYGDECSEGSMYLEGDVSRDQYVNLIDLIKMSEQWLIGD